MNNRPIFGQQRASAQRVQAALQSINSNDPMSCKACGSIYFIEMTASMYTSGSYGFRSQSQSPMKVFQCICGKIVVPSNLRSSNVAGSERDMFAQSLDYAVAYRKENGVEQIAQAFAGVEELEFLAGQIQELQQRYNVLATSNGLQPVQVIDTVPVEQSQPEYEEQDEPVAPPSRGISAKRAQENPVRNETPFEKPGRRGRSMVSGSPQQGDAKIVADPRRPASLGNARQRMSRQGIQPEVDETIE